MPLKYKLGKLPARKDAVKFKLTDYLDLSALPKPPKTFGHEKLVSSWQMLGNDTVGDCVLAGGGHETMLWNKEANKTVSISTQDAISDYSAITGYDPKDPNSDQGTDMQTAASYRLKTGLKASDKRHKIGAYLAITPGNIDELKQAIYLFSAVGIGINFPSSAMDQFNEGKPWTVVKSSIEGGHYIPGIGYDTKYFYIVTWGKCIQASSGFIKKYMDEGIAYLSEEFLINDKSLEGFNSAQLNLDLKALK